MEKEFIPYEQALALKELGFDEPCMAGYDISTNQLFIGYEHNHDFYTQAPLYQQAFRWFREEYNLPAWIYESEGKWFWKIVKGDFWEQNQKPYTYEEAQLECLKKLIEIIKQKANEK
jgi:hypothetical protein